MNHIMAQLGSLLHQQQEAIQQWFATEYARSNPFFYSSVDLRYSGYKIAPVDTNLFPAGFNLLSVEDKVRATASVKRFLSTHHPHAQTVLVITENHTRNTYYLANVESLCSIIAGAGLDVIYAPLESEALCKKNDYLYYHDIKPDIIIVNNDLTSGAPALLQDILQPVLPPVGMGWYQRSKTAHFDTYAEVVRRFGLAFQVDPWLISTSFKKCGQINFAERQGLECVANNVERCLHMIQKKYDEYHIPEVPYVFIKANRGTYGMGIMTVSSPDEVFEINKKSRNKMKVIKEGTENTEVIIQEGIPTIDTVDGKAAEPMLYLIHGDVVGSMYRVHETRDNLSNLNAPGMRFVNACDADKQDTAHSPCPVRGLIARLATLAAAMECYELHWEI